MPPEGRSLLHQTASQPFSAAYEQVECCECGKRYQCTPANDYYHRPGIANHERTLHNGVCETCLLMGASLHPDNVIERVVET